MNRFTIRSVLGLTVTLLCACSATIRIQLPEPKQLPANREFRAGAAQRDLTPHPGFPMGGHSIGGKIARGWWTRLYARCIYLEAPNGEALLLVSCDLWSMPAGLADRVVELLGERDGTRHLGREDVLIAATHTHHSPGNFSSSKTYNSFGSPIGGFDPRLFEFFARRVADAAAEAVHEAEQAVLSFAEEPRVVGVARNRSLGPFLRNPEAATILLENESIPLPPDPQPAMYPDPACHHAVDPRLQALFVERKGAPNELIAAIGFFAVHTTSIGNGLEVYSADLLGVASREGARRLRHGETEPIVAWFNGAEADVSPIFGNQDVGDALNLGNILATALVDARAKAVEIESPTLDSELGYFSVADQSFVDEHGVVRRTAKSPLPGVATLGGAEDGLTLFHELGWIEGVTGRRSADHGSKHPAFDPRFLPIELPFSLTRLVGSAGGPEDVPLSIHGIGPLRLVGLPGEFSTAGGRRIRNALMAEDVDVVLVGLAGEYLSYFATPEEYEEQHYEGASTMYGPASMPLVLARLREIASDGAPAPRGKRRYSAGSVRRFEVKDAGSLPYEPTDGLSEVFGAPGTGTSPPAPAFRWTGRTPFLPEHPDGSERLTPELSIEVFSGCWHTYNEDGAPVDDRGVQFVVLGQESDDGEAEWLALWTATSAPAGRYRYRVRTLSGGTIHSDPFEIPNSRSWTRSLGAD